MEQLNAAFLHSMGSEVPLTTQRYQNRIPVIHHGFPKDLEALLQRTIRELKA
jgi:hypothetical protein